MFYRLGQSIEHSKKKYGVLPPKDFNKWARICEHIILHFNEGWADGYHYGIEYWEIWNEPDLNQEDFTKSPTWQGTKEQFFDLYEIASKHLKSKFPNLKIGGPALAWLRDWAADFLSEMQRRNVPIDFFSWHRYDKNPRRVGEICDIFREMLDKNGYTRTESILNEWNYLRNWDVEFVYSLQSIAGIKGASYATAMMCVCQNKPLDMLMYYDARIGAVWNGLFDIISLRPGKTYYPYLAFHQLSLLGNEVALECDNPNIYTVAASDGNQTQLLISYYNEEDILSAENVELTFCADYDGELRFYLTDEKKDHELVRTIEFSKGEQSIQVPLQLFDIYHIILENKL